METQAWDYWLHDQGLVKIHPILAKNQLTANLAI